MTRRGTYVLTALAVAVFAVLTWAFADGQFSTLWDKEDWTGSAIFTVGFMGLIVLTGYYQARRLPDAGIALAPATDSTIPGQLEDPKSWKLLLGNTYLALFCCRCASSSGANGSRLATTSWLTSRAPG